jgi:hypothetical protein
MNYNPPHSVMTCNLAQRLVSRKYTAQPLALNLGSIGFYGPFLPWPASRRKIEKGKPVPSIHPDLRILKKDSHTCIIESRPDQSVPFTDLVLICVEEQNRNSAPRSPIVDENDLAPLFHLFPLFSTTIKIGISASLSDLTYQIARLSWPTPIVLLRGFWFEKWVFR